jgi:hypothetical protein
MNGGLNRMKNIEFNYENQCWIVDGIIQRCGHPEEMQCGCFGKVYAGVPFAEVA